MSADLFLLSALAGSAWVLAWRAHRKARRAELLATEAFILALKTRYGASQRAAEAMLTATRNGRR